MIVTKKIVLVIPVFNDWASALELVKNLSESLSSKKEILDICVTFVDDGSTDVIPSLKDLSQFGLYVEVLALSLNVGHQRAIMTGLRHVLSMDYEFALVMDSDGEDTTEGVSKLLEASQTRPNAIIVAQRGLRSEKFSFRALYRTHKLIFRVLSGKKLDFGNFVLLPMSAVEKVTSMADSSSHLPSSILQSNIPLVRIRVDRGSRYFGESKMNFEKLVSHSFASLAVFSDQIMVRLMIFSIFSTLATVLGIIMVVVTRLFSDAATPGWATAAVGLLLVISFQVLSFVGLGTLITLNLTSLKNFYRNQSDIPKVMKSLKE
jgi:glycosyltransferase involved in cell wall biosynthesis